MAQQNVEIVRRVYEGWARGDFSEADEFHPEVEFELADWPHPGRSRGLEAMWRTWRAALGAWDDFRAEPYDFIEAGQHVVVLNHIYARGKGSGAEVSADTATVWTMDAGKVVRLALYWDIATALEAAGLPEKPMSEANEELVRGYYEAASRGEFERAGDYYSDDVELMVAPGLGVESGTYSGPEEVGRWFLRWFSTFAAGYRFQSKEIRTAGATVLVVADHVARGLKSGLELREETASAFRVHDGEITRVELYRTREEALEAVELPE
jgi:ketosteroid isomerase-like protein